MQGKNRFDENVWKVNFNIDGGKGRNNFFYLEFLML